MSDTAAPGAATVEVTPTPAAPATPVIPAETVTLPKGEFDQLQRDAARAGTAQSEAARLRKIAFGNARPTFGATPPPAPSAEDLTARAVEEDRKAEAGLKNLVLDPKYREVLDSDPTLRDLFIKNPLAVIPVLASDPFDAEDAIGQVRGRLDERLLAIKAPVATPVPAAPAAPTAPAPGAVAASAPIADEEYEAARKNPSTEKALLGMISVGLKRMGGKNGS